MLGGGGNSQAAAACRSYAIACDPGSLIVVFFVAFLIAVDLKLKVCLLLCCLLDRGRSQAQGISLFGRSAVWRICGGRSVERDN